MKRIITTTAAFLLLAGSVSAAGHVSRTSVDTLVDAPEQEAGEQARGTEVMSARPEVDEDASERGLGGGNGVNASNATFEDTTEEE